ncbi:MAG: hypothetical protein KC996_08430 [Phycisphaerales bacterium]|nr:hypothetical protein [Phycisphaerales bacterium]
MHWKNRDQSLSWCAGSILAISALSASANAEVILNAPSEFGATSVTVDVTNGLEFLDLGPTAVLSVSYDDMTTTYLAAGGTYEGWRYASYTEILSLFESAGVTVESNYLFPASTAIALSESLGITFSKGADIYRANGFFHSEVEGFASTFAFGASLNHDTDEYYATYEGWTYLSSDNSAPAGHYLVRAVPAPGSLAIAGVFGMLCTHRRR